MRRFSLGTEPYREMSESNLAIIAREFKNRGFIEDEEEEDSDSDTVAVIQVDDVTSPVGDGKPTTAQKVRYVLSDRSEGGGDVTIGDHFLFTQMDVLVSFERNQYGWKQISRWVKYEQTVETGGRWSKPHVSTTSMRGLNALRRAIVDGHCSVSLDVATSGQFEVAEAVMTSLKAGSQQLDEETLRRIMEVMVAPHKHKHRKLRKSHSNQPHAQGSMFRRRSGQDTDVAASLYQFPPGTDPSWLMPYQPNTRLAKKLPKNTEAANILIGQVDFLTERVMTLCRLESAALMGDLTEVAIPTRFVFVSLSPANTIEDREIWQASEIARSLAVLFSDKVFCEVAYKAQSSKDIVAGIDEYAEDLTVLPPSVWDPAIRIEPPEKPVKLDKVVRRLDDKTRGPEGPSEEPQEEGASSDTTLKRTGRIFGGFVNDIKNRYPYYLSDITDALQMQCLASIFFIFFAVISPVVTFGGVLGQKTDGYVGTIETLLAGAVCGTTYALFSGQPLTIISATGPLLVFESILYQTCKDNDLPFVPFRFWIGFWVMVALLIIVAFELSFLVRYITRFTEECFACLVSVIFIYEAFHKLADITVHQPIHTGVVREDPDEPLFCHCVPTSTNTSSALTMTPETILQFALNGSVGLTGDCVTYKDVVSVRPGCLTEEQCTQLGWNLNGTVCNQHYITRAVPDVFLLSVVLCLGTFGLAVFLRGSRSGRWFPAIVRGTAADFAVFSSVVIFTLVDFVFGVPTPKLNVPDQVAPTHPSRDSFLVNPGSIDPWWLSILAILPALLATILIFLDQQITAVIVNRKEHKLKKPHGYHLDLFVVAILIFICSLLGLTWFVAATVQAISHVRSLLRESDVKIPGEKPQIIGIREQRVTGFCVFALIGLSTLVTPVLRLIPMPVLYGVFLYMGFTALPGLQFIERLYIMPMPVKYQPDLIYLRHVKTRRIHIFTLIQTVCFAAIMVVKEITVTSLAFPLTLLMMMGVRKLMDFLFTRSELYWLDHNLPGDERVSREDEQAQAHAYSPTGAIGGFNDIDFSQNRKSTRSAEETTNF